MHFYEVSDSLGYIVRCLKSKENKRFSEIVVHHIRRTRLKFIRIC